MAGFVAPSSTDGGAPRSHDSPNHLDALTPCRAVLVAQDSDPPDVTRMLEEIGDGRRSVSEDLLPVVYDQLRAIASRRMVGERADHTLDATALVHEAWMRLVREDDLSWTSRPHFYGAAAAAMRRILVEHARRRGRRKRGGDHRRLDLELADVGLEVDPGDLLAVEEALTRLEAMDPRAADVVKLRFFAGLEVEEVAATLGISERTARREWMAARAFLARALGD